MTSLLLVLVLGQLAVPSPAEAPDLSLDEALRQAATQNFDLAAARARLDKARASSAKAWAGYLPLLTAGASYTRNSAEAVISLPTGYAIRDLGMPTSGPFDPTREPGPDNPPGAPTQLSLLPTSFASVVVQKQNQLGAQVELRQALVAPALWAAIQNADRAVDLGELQYDAGRRELLFGVARAYFAAAGLNEAGRVQERLMGSLRQQLKNARLRVEAGAAPTLDALRAEIDLARAEQDLVRTRNAYASAKSALATLLGRDPDFEVPGREALPPPLPTPDPQGLAQSALEQRPDLKAAREAEELARGLRRGVLYGYLPNLNLAAQYRVANVSGFTGDPSVWAVIASLNWTLWDGGLREAQLREANAGIVEARAQREGLELKAQDELRRAFLEIASARANQQTARRQLELATKSLSLVQLSYEAGAATSLDVSNANSAVLAAELSLLNETLSAYLASLQALKAAGQFDVPASPPGTSP